MSNANTRRARDLRNYINALALDLAGCQTPAEVRCLKQAVRAAEFELTALGVAA